MANQKFLLLNLLLLCHNYNTVFGFEDETADDNLQIDLENILKVRQKLLQVGTRNPEVLGAIRQWDIRKTHTPGSTPKASSKDQCSSDLSYVLDDLIFPGPKGDRKWALQLVDSYAKPPAGFLRGQISWPGNYDECLKVSAPPANLSANGFRGRYAWLSLILQSNQTNRTVTVNVGACFPDSCSEDNILHLYNVTEDKLDFIFFWEKVSPKLPKLGVKFVQEKYPLNSAAVACICICGLFATLVFAGTVVDVVKRWKEKQPLVLQRTQKDPAIVHHSDEPNVNDLPTSSVNSANPDEIDGSDTAHLVVIAKHHMKSVGTDFLLCFSAVSNTESILNTKSSEGHLECVHGIRFLSMAWVILGHTYFFGLSLYGNILDLIEKVDTWPIQVILQGTFSVDTFFLLSGCLLTYHFLKNKEKFTGVKNWIMFYVHRYVRLTPVYAMVMFVLATWFSSLGNGPYWNDQIRQTCSKSWWWHLLYVNNFLDAVNMCVGWAWYLANDMQFYFISPIFLLAFKRNRAWGIAIVSVLLLASWIATGVLSRVYKIAVIFSNIDNASEDQLATQQGDMFDKVYTKPYTRIGPYLVGVLLGCFLEMANGRQKFLHKWVVIVGWMLSQALSLALLYGLLKSHIGPITGSAHNALARSAWGISVGWVIYACLTGHAGPVNTFLSWKVWIPLSRLTYCAYLVHPMVMMWYFGTLRTVLYFTTSQVVILYLSFMMLSYGVALIASLLFEAPIMKLEKFIKNL